MVSAALDPAIGTGLHLGDWTTRDGYLRIEFWRGDPSCESSTRGWVVVPTAAFDGSGRDDGRPCSACRSEGPHAGLHLGAVSYSDEALTVVAIWRRQNSSHPLAVHTPLSLQTPVRKAVWQVRS